MHGNSEGLKTLWQMEILINIIMQQCFQELSAAEVSKCDFGFESDNRLYFIFVTFINVLQNKWRM